MLESFLGEGRAAGPQGSGESLITQVVLVQQALPPLESVPGGVGPQLGGPPVAAQTALLKPPETGAVHPPPVLHRLGLGAERAACLLALVSHLT